MTNKSRRLVLLIFCMFCMVGIHYKQTDAASYPEFQDMTITEYPTQAKTYKAGNGTITVTPDKANKKIKIVMNNATLEEVHFAVSIGKELPAPAISPRILGKEQADEELNSEELLKDSGSSSGAQKCDIDVTIIGKCMISPSLVKWNSLAYFYTVNGDVNVDMTKGSLVKAVSSSSVFYGNNVVVKGGSFYCDFEKLDKAGTYSIEKRGEQTTSLSADNSITLIDTKINCDAIYITRELTSPKGIFIKGNSVVNCPAIVHGGASISIDKTATANILNRSVIDNNNRSSRIEVYGNPVIGDTYYRDLFYVSDPDRKLNIVVMPGAVWDLKVVAAGVDQNSTLDNQGTILIEENGGMHIVCDKSAVKNWGAIICNGSIRLPDGMSAEEIQKIGMIGSGTVYIYRDAASGVVTKYYTTGKVKTDNDASCQHVMKLRKDINYVEPTCSKAGSRVYACTTCGFTKMETLKVLNHSMGKMIITPATCLKAGSKVQKCIFCGYTKTTVIDKIPIPKKGASLTSKTVKYKITKAVVLKNGKVVSGTVKYVKPINGKGKVTIPAKITVDGVGYKVTAVGKKAFSKNKRVTSVVIGSSVTKIEPSAFYGCKKLKKITIRSTKLKSVGKNAIKGIHKNATIKVPKKKKKLYRRLLSKKTGYVKTMKMK